MNKLIALDPGHGLDTAGKRTPNFADGSFMKEREFNIAVANKLEKMLVLNGLRVINVAESDKDVPLSTRVRLANNSIRNKYNQSADLFISIHANAFGNEFNSANGIETFVYSSIADNSFTNKFAKTIQRELIDATKLKDRGVKKASFYVVKNTLMPAILIECGFMTNLEEAMLLKSDSYRQIIANALLKGVCKIYNKDIKEENANDKVPDWQKVAFQKLIDNNIIKSPKYWEGKLNENITVGEVLALIAGI